MVYGLEPDGLKPRLLRTQFLQSRRKFVYYLDGQAYGNGSYPSRTDIDIYYIHRDPAIFGDWVPSAYRKLLKRKLRGYCYVVIRTDDRKNTEIFEKTENCEAIYM